MQNVKTFDLVAFNDQTYSGYGEALACGAVYTLGTGFVHPAQPECVAAAKAAYNAASCLDGNHGLVVYAVGHGHIWPNECGATVVEKPVDVKQVLPAELQGRLLRYPKGMYGDAFEANKQNMLFSSKAAVIHGDGEGVDLPTFYAAVAGIELADPDSSWIYGFRHVSGHFVTVQELFYAIDELKLTPLLALTQ